MSASGVPYEVELVGGPADGAVVVIDYDVWMRGQLRALIDEDQEPERYQRRGDMRRWQYTP